VLDQDQRRDRPPFFPHVVEIDPDQGKHELRVYNNRWSLWEPTVTLKIPRLEQDAAERPAWIRVPRQDRVDPMLTAPRLQVDP